ncbi:hypothetical protein ACTPDI_20455 [Clostridioides difficile]
MSKTKEKKCKECTYKKKYKKQLYLDVLCLTLTLLQSVWTTLSIIKFFYN